MEAPTLTPVRGEASAPPLVHLSAPPHEKALCGRPRGDEPLKPGAEVTCVVCLDIAEARRA